MECRRTNIADGINYKILFLSHFGTLCVYTGLTPCALHHTIGSWLVADDSVLLFPLLLGGEDAVLFRVAITPNSTHIKQNYFCCYVEFLKK